MDNEPQYFILNHQKIVNDYKFILFQESIKLKETFKSFTNNFLNSCLELFSMLAVSIETFSFLLSHFFWLSRKMKFKLRKESLMTTSS